MKRDEEQLNQRFWASLQSILNRADTGPSQPRPTARGDVGAAAPSRKYTRLGVLVLGVLHFSILLGLFFLFFSAHAGSNSPDLFAESGSSALRMEEESSSMAASGDWREKLSPIWEGRIDVSLGYGQGRDWKWHDIFLHRVQADERTGQVYLFGRSRNGGHPRNFRLDKITRFRTWDGRECVPHGMDGAREAMFSILESAPM